MKAIIYQIKNLINSKVYIGSTSNLVKRKYRHLSTLRKGNHHSIKLQNSYNKYGEENFVFEILLVKDGCTLQEKIELEQIYLDLYKSYDVGYNMLSIAHNGVDDTFWTEERRYDMGQKVSRKHKGKTPKNLESLREIQKRSILEFEGDVFIREYSSAKEAGEILNVPYKNINNFLRGKIKKSKEYPDKRWEYKDGLPIREVKTNTSSNWKKGKYRIEMTNLEDNTVTIYENLLEVSTDFKVGKSIIGVYCRNGKVFRDKFIFKYL